MSNNEVKVIANSLLFHKNLSSLKINISYTDLEDNQ